MCYQVDYGELENTVLANLLATRQSDETRIDPCKLNAKLCTGDLIILEDSELIYFSNQERLDGGEER